jgi:hypothetical protein
VGSRSKARARAQASQNVSQRSSGPQPGATRKPGAAGRQGSARTAGQQFGRRIAGQGGSGGADQAGSSAAAQPGQMPRTVLALAVIEAIEAAGILVAAILAGLDTGSGKSYQLASGIAITAIGIGTALALALVARGIRAGRRWSRTPALLTQLFAGIVAIYLLQAPRYDWGVPALLLAIAGLAMLFAPASMAVLTPGRPDEPDAR